MLIKIRDKASGWLAYVIVGFLAIPFALWGIQSYFVSLSPAVLQVGDEEIDLDQFNQAVLDQKRYLQSVGSEINSEYDVTIQTLSNLASRLLVQSAIDYYGYQVSDQQLAEEIAADPAFHNTDGSFDETKYRQYLSNQQFSRVNYENTVRTNIELSQFRNQIPLTSFTLPAEQTDFDELVNEERKLRYLVINTEHYIEPGSVTEEEIKSQYDNNLRDYTSELKFRLRYVELTVDNILDEGKIEQATEQDVEEYYEENLERFVEPETRVVRHILFDKDAHSSAELQKRIDIVQDQLENGEDFATLAAEYSDDFLTASNGGKLPPLSEFDIEDEAIGDAIFTMSEGDVSEPLESSFGIQIFELQKTIPEVHRSVEEAHDEIVYIIESERAQEQYALLLEEMTNISEITERGLFYEFSQQMQMSSTVTEWMTPNSRENIFAYDKVRSVAFNEVLVGKSMHSGPIEVAEGAHTIFFNVAGTEEPKQFEFDEVKEDIREKLLFDKALQEARKQGEEWLTQLSEGEKEFDSIAELEWVQLTDIGYVTRTADDDDIPVTVVLAAFNVVYDGEGQAYAPSNVAGETAIVELSGLRQQEFNENEEPLSFAQREGIAVMESLREIFAIDVFEENLPESLLSR